MLRIVFITEDEDFLTELAKHPPTEEPASRTPLEVNMDEPLRVPGATGSWWELAAALGILSFPLSVAGNLLATWIWSALKNSPTPKTKSACKVKIILRHGDKSADITIESNELAPITSMVTEALHRVYPER